MKQSKPTMQQPLLRIPQFRLIQGSLECKSTCCACPMCSGFFSTLFILPFSLHIRSSHKCHLYAIRSHPTYTSTYIDLFYCHSWHSIAPVRQYFHILDFHPHKVISPALFLSLYHTQVLSLAVCLIIKNP